MNSYRSQLDNSDIDNIVRNPNLSTDQLDKLKYMSLFLYNSHLRKSSTPIQVHTFYSFLLNMERILDR